MLAACSANSVPTTQRKLFPFSARIWFGADHRVSSCLAADHRARVGGWRESKPIWQSSRKKSSGFDSTAYHMASFRNRFREPRSMESRRGRKIREPFRKESKTSATSRNSTVQKSFRNDSKRSVALKGLCSLQNQLYEGRQTSQQGIRRLQDGSRRGQRAAQ